MFIYRSIGKDFSLRVLSPLLTRRHVMETREAVLALEKELKKRLIIERVIECVIVVLFLTLGISCYALREASREVITHQIGSYTYETVSYNDDYIFGIALGLGGGIGLAAVPILDFILCGFKTVTHKEGYITIFRSMGRSSVYVNGEEKGRLGFFGWEIPTVEIWLPNKVKVIVTFSRGWMSMAQITFSDNTPSIEV